MTPEEATRWVWSYVENGFAITWTRGKTGDAAKEVTKKDWQKTRPLEGEIGSLAGQFANKFERANPAVVTGASGLVSIDGDDEAGLAQYQELAFPETLSIRSSPGKGHFHFHAPSGAEYAYFEFRNGTVKAKTTQYLLIPPAVHPSGVPYTVINGAKIAELSEADYEKLLRLSNTTRRRVRESAATPGAKISVGSRHDFLHENVWGLANKGLGVEAIVTGILDLNATRLEEPLEPAEVEKNARRSYQGFLEKGDPPKLSKAAQVEEELSNAIADFDSGEEEEEGDRPYIKPTWSGHPPKLASCPKILEEFSKNLTRLGVAGETQLTQLAYLTVTSRVLPWGEKQSERPVSVIPKGTSSSGKSFALDSVIRFFPDGAVLTLTSSSRLYLLYQDKSLSHRFLYVPEWSTLKDDEDLISILRTLVSKGHINHGTVEGQGKKEARELVKEGPTGLLMTTTAATTDRELETRCLTLRTDDSSEQTGRVFEVIADQEEEADHIVDLSPWHDLQNWLEAQDTRTVIPFIRALATLMPTRAVRLRRDFTTILCLIRAHALLHQRNRERDSRGRVVAALADYEVVRALVDSLLAEEVEAHAPEALRETVKAVEEIIAAGKDHATVRDIADRLNIGKPAAYNRVHRALASDYLVNVASGKGYKLQLGAELPGAGEFLPATYLIEDVWKHLPPKGHVNRVNV